MVARRTCVHLLLGEHQNHNWMLNNHQQEDAGNPPPQRRHPMSKEEEKATTRQEEEHNHNKIKSHARQVGDLHGGAQ